MERFWSKVVKQPTGCWEWQAARNHAGYGVFNYAGTATKTMLAHRWSWRMANEMAELARHDVIMHACDNPACVNPAHLSRGTHADNASDKYRKGRGNLGERHGMHKLTDEAVREIREVRAGMNGKRARRGSGKSLHDLAERYGVSYGAVQAVVAESLWKHL